MRIAAAALVAGFVALLLNSAYLGAAATPSLFYAVNVLLHVVLGASLAAIGAWRLRGARADAALAVAAPLLAVAAIAGFYLSVAGAAGAARAAHARKRGITSVPKSSRLRIACSKVRDGMLG